MEKGKNKYKYLILIIYAVMFLFMAFKMAYYEKYAVGFPDEMAHVAYIAYLEQEQAVIPEFKDMRQINYLNYNNPQAPKLSPNNQYVFDNTFNYLCHPPLYYQIMRLSGGVEVKDNIITVDFVRLRLFNIMLASLGLLLILYMGYSRIGKKPLLHLLYATIVVSIPMLAYSCAGVNNDTLALIAVSIFVFGLLRFVEQKRNFGTYLLISIGVSLAFLSKLTAGLIVLISIILFLIFIFIKEKNLWFLISKKFLATIPICLISASYFIIVYLQTGSISPSYRLLDPQGYQTSFAYVNVANRTALDFSHYVDYFIHHFLTTWTVIISTNPLVDSMNIFTQNNIAILGILFIPLLLLFQIKKSIKKSPVILAFISVYIALIISMVIQFLRAYNEYVNISGYLGGHQSRYYFCGISAIALGIVFIFKSIFDKIDNETLSQNTVALQSSKAKSLIKYKEITVTIVCLVFITLLFYVDFIYFFLGFMHYILKHIL